MWTVASPFRLGAALSSRPFDGSDAVRCLRMKAPRPLQSWRRAVSNPEQFSSLIGDIYEAAMEPALWPGVLKQIAAFVGGSAAAFYAKDAATKTGSVYYDYGASDVTFNQF